MPIDPVRVSVEEGSNGVYPMKAISFVASSAEEGKAHAPLPSPARGTAFRAIQALSRLQQLHSEKQKEAEELMEKFGCAVSNQASEAEIKRLSFEMEKAQAEARHLETLKQSVDAKQAEAEAALERFGHAVGEHATEDEQLLLSRKVEEATEAFEQEQAAKLQQYEAKTEIAKKLERMRLKAAKAQEELRMQAERKPVLRSVKSSLEKTQTKRPNVDAGKRSTSNRSQEKRNSSDNRECKANGAQQRPNTRLNASTALSKWRVPANPQPPNSSRSTPRSCAIRDQIRNACVPAADRGSKRTVPLPLPR